MKTIRITSVAVVALCAPQALAQSLVASAEPDSRASAEDIIVTAQRRAERLQDVPISITVKSGEQLARAGIVDSRGLEQVTPGLSMQQKSGFLLPALRGVSSSVVTAGAENPIAIYLDGVYVSSLAGGIIDLPDVERVEVLKGPQGTLFGRNATGGAIQVITKSPTFTPTARINFTAGYFDGAGSSRPAHDLGVNGYASGPIVDDLLAASIAFLFRRSNGYSTNIAFSQVSAAEQRAYGSNRLGKSRNELVRAKFLLTPSDNLDILLTGFYSKTRSDRSEIGYVDFGGTASGPAQARGANGQLLYPNYIAGTKPWQYAFDALAPLATLSSRGFSGKVNWETGLGTITSTTAYSYTKSTEGHRL